MTTSLGSGSRLARATGWYVTNDSAKAAICPACAKAARKEGWADEIKPGVVTIDQACDCCDAPAYGTNEED